MSELRDPRAFKVHNHEISFPKDDAVLAALLKGSRPQDYVSETYRKGQTIPAGRLPLSAVGVFEPRGDVEAVVPKGAAPAPAVTTTAAATAPAAPKGGGA